MADALQSVPAPIDVHVQPPALPVVGSAAQFAKLLVIDSQDTYEFANTYLGEIKANRKKLDDQRKTIVEPLNAAKAAVQNIFNPVLADHDEAEEIVKKALLAYTNEQKRIQAAEQARLDELARKQREALEKQAVKAADKGQLEKAAMLTATAAVVAPVVATSTYVQPKGLSTRKIWKGRVTDKKALLASLLQQPAFIDRLITIAEGDLNKLAVALEGNIPLDGIECYQEETLARRAA